MRYKNNYFVAEDIKTKKITYGFFSKEGGCSKGNYDSLNCSNSSGDNRKLVTANINIAKKKLGLENRSESNKILGPFKHVRFHFRNETFKLGIHTQTDNYNIYCWIVLICLSLFYLESR